MATLIKSNQSKPKEEAPKPKAQSILTALEIRRRSKGEKK